MRNILIASILVGTAAFGSIGEAAAFQRNGSLQTSRGTITSSADTYCFEGTCYREAQLTGINGNTLQQSGQCTVTSPGVWACEGKWVGPKGGSASHSGTWIHN
ncbi:hypothetical protein [Devosia sp.]|uniref:hypothetical protein n=1 Tax=Devosia sp. TaxID=1871048 RepID=UPI003BACB3FB